MYWRNHVELFDLQDLCFVSSMHRWILKCDVCCCKHRFQSQEGTKTFFCKCIHFFVFVRGHSELGEKWFCLLTCKLQSQTYVCISTRWDNWTFIWGHVHQTLRHQHCSSSPLEAPPLFWTSWKLGGGVKMATVERLTPSFLINIYTLLDPQSDGAATP